MESNVSKNTNSHNFFKLRFNQEKLDISVKNLLKQELLLILDLYQQKFNVQIEPKLLTTILSAKLKISQPKNPPVFQKKSIIRRINSDHHGFPANFLPIIYACPLGMSLSANLPQSPQTIMEQLSCLLTVEQNQLDLTNQDFSDQLLTEIVSLGWLNFYLDSQLLANWLRRSLCWSLTNAVDDQQSTVLVTGSLKLTKANLFPVQYIHARCCSLLSLAAREKLITLSANLKQIRQPQSISWLDREDNLWFSEVAEQNLLQQLLIVSDSWLENIGIRRDPKHWLKMVLNLSQVTAIFLAECRWLGEVKQLYPQKAIARLGLIALVQFWLEKILVEKLGIAAPREL